MGVRRLLLPLLLLAAAGCGGPDVVGGGPVVVDRTPELDLYAEQVVWNGAFGLYTPLPPQHVVTVPDCQDAFGNYGISTSGGACVLGYAGWPGDGTHVWTVWWFWEGAYSRSALAHELNHCRLGESSACPDPLNCDPGDSTHSDPSWQTLVPEAVRLLESVNL